MKKCYILVVLQKFDLWFFLCYEDTLDMFSQLIFGLRVLIFRLSPSTWIDNKIIQAKRIKAYKKAMQERVLIYQLELAKIQNKMKISNEKWKKSELSLKKNIQKLTSVKFSDEIVATTSQNFILFLKQLNYSQDIEFKVSGLEQVISKVVNLSKVNSQKIVESKNPTLPYFKIILNNYTTKTRAELEYWKLEKSKEKLEEEISSLREKLNNFVSFKEYSRV